MTSSSLGAIGYIYTCHALLGYDSMGYELSKPMLRAELEADLKRCVFKCVT